MMGGSSTNQWFKTTRNRYISLRVYKVVTNNVLCIKWSTACNHYTHCLLHWKVAPRGWTCFRWLTVHVPSATSSALPSTSTRKRITSRWQDSGIPTSRWDSSCIVIVMETDIQCTHNQQITPVHPITAVHRRPLQGTISSNIVGVFAVYIV